MKDVFDVEGLRIILFAWFSRTLTTLTLGMDVCPETFLLLFDSLLLYLFFFEVCFTISKISTSAFVHLALVLLTLTWFSRFTNSLVGAV